MRILLQFLAQEALAHWLTAMEVTPLLYVFSHTYVITQRRQIFGQTQNIWICYYYYLNTGQVVFKHRTLNTGCWKQNSLQIFFFFLRGPTLYLTKFIPNLHPFSISLGWCVYLESKIIQKLYHFVFIQLYLRAHS